MGLFFVAASGFAQESAKVSLKAPSMKGFPTFLNLWREEYPDFEKETLDASPLEISLPDTFLQESGSLLILGLEPDFESKDMKIWIKLLRDLYPILESARPVPKFRRTLKLTETQVTDSLAEKSSTPGHFVPVEVPKNASPWEKQLCEKVIPWLHAAQLLAGRTQRAERKGEARRKEVLPLRLQCKLKTYEELKVAPHFLQLAEWPLPYREGDSEEILFRQPQDLSSKEILMKLQKVAPLPQ